MKSPLVLLHAFPLSSKMWNGLDALTPDLPGFGKSKRQAAPSIPDMAVEVAKFLDQKGIQIPVILGGLSMGGYVAFEFYRQFPQRVYAMGLFSTRAALDTPEAKAARFETAERIRKNGLESLAKAVMPKLLGKTTLESKPEVAKKVTQLILENDREGVADSLIAMAHRRDSTDLLAQMNFPVLVVAGEEDSFIPVDEARKMSSQVPGARLEVIPRAGHLLNLEQPQRFQQILTDFLQIHALSP